MKSLFRDVNRAIGKLNTFQTAVVMFAIVGYIVAVVYIGVDFEGACRDAKRLFLNY